MKDTKLVKLTGTSADKNVLEEAGRLIRQGELVIFPTETVYGIGANGLPVGLFIQLRGDPVTTRLF